MLAQNVETAAQLERCQTLGFDLFQGYFFARPALNLTHKLKPAQLSLIRLLALAMEDADTSEIENAFKHEPGLTLDLLRPDQFGGERTDDADHLRCATRSPCSAGDSCNAGCNC